MKQIDWSKAPEGATHTNRNNSCWFKFDEHGNSQFANSSGFWAKNGYSFSDYDVPGELIQRPRQWNGEGLPPVGTVCEFAGGTHCPVDPFDKDLKEGMQVTIIAHFKSGDFILAAFTFDPQNPGRGMVQVEQGNFGCFRPIRTAEQIAAEERAAEVAEMIDLSVEGHQAVTIAQARILCTQLHKAGYRKQAQP